MQRGVVHLGIVGPIRRLLQQYDGDEDNDEDDQQERRRRNHHHRLMIQDANEVDCQSVQYLVDFLSHGEETYPVITDLCFNRFSLCHPPDGGLNVICDLFSNNNTTLTTVSLYHCDFGNTHEASQLLAALQTSNVMDLTIQSIDNLRRNHVLFGNCISGLLLNMPQLERLSFGEALVNVETIRSAFQPSTTHQLKSLDLSRCGLDDEGLCLVVDAFVGSKTLQILSISFNNITFRSLDDITRLIKFTRLQKLFMGQLNTNLFDDSQSNENFISALHQHNTSLEVLQSGIDLEFNPELAETVTTIHSILTRNICIRHADALLALQPRTGMPIASKSGIWYMAMAEFVKWGRQQHEPQMHNTSTSTNSDDDQTPDDSVDSNMNDSDAVIRMLLPRLEEHGSDKNEVDNDDDDDDDNEEEENDDDALPIMNDVEYSPIVVEEQGFIRFLENEFSVNGGSNDRPAADFVVSYPGASAIYKILQTRPGIFEKQLKRPPPPPPPITAISTVSSYRQALPTDSDNDHGTNNAVEIQGTNKRCRLEYK